MPNISCTKVLSLTTHLMISVQLGVQTKHIIFVSLIVLIWQFCFPYQGQAAETVAETQALTIPVQKHLMSAVKKTTNRLPENPDRPQPQAKQSLRIPVTAYSSTPDQTSGDPFITASGARVRDGIIAANFLPIGARVRFPEKFGNKIFVVEDRMSARYWYKADIWMETRGQALQWGVQYTTIEIL